MSSHRRLPSFGTAFGTVSSSSSERSNHVWPAPNSEAYIVSRAGMTDFTTSLSDFIVRQCQRYIPPALHWPRAQLILLGDSSPYDVAIVDGDAIPDLPGPNKPSERRDCLLRAIQANAETISRQLSSLRKAPPLRIIKGVVRRTICSMGDKVAPRLTEVEAEADFVLLRVMHESGAMEVQFVLMSIYETLWGFDCSCLGNISVLAAWSDYSKWETARKARGPNDPARKKAVKGKGMMLRGNPCCPLHSLNPETAADSAPRLVGRHVMKRTPNEGPRHTSEHPDRYISFFYETNGYRIEGTQTSASIKRDNVVSVSVPIHPPWPKHDGAALQPLLVQHAETIATQLLDEERKTGLEQYILIGLERANGGMWQPKPVKGSATAHERNI